MAAPVMDKLIPTSVFIIAMMATVIQFTIWMTPTINDNVSSNIEAPDIYSNPDYLTTMYENGTYVVWDPNPYHMNYSARETDFWSDGVTSPTCTFSSDYPKEAKNIVYWGIASKWGHQGLPDDHDLHELRFMQHGGWAGAEKYSRTIYPDDWHMEYNNSASPYWYCNIQLRHTYLVSLAPTYGNDTWTSFYNWTFDLRIEHLINGTQKASPWTVVAQLFTFSLPGVPLFIQALIMVPIGVAVAIVTYALVRSVFPG